MTRLLALSLLFLTLAASLAAQDRLDALAARSGAFVQAVKNDLVQRGVIPTPQRDNCDAFQITARVAWRLRAQGARLIPKSAAQNGCTWLGVRYSHDAIGLNDGWVDLLVGAGPPQNVNGPAWQFTPGPPAMGPAPFDLDAALAPPVVTPPVIPPVIPPVDPPLPPLPPQVLTELIAKLFLEVQQLRLNSEALMDALAQVRAEQSDSRTAHAHGLQGSLFGYPVLLKPVP
jgi:hypothetical protein